MTAYLHISEFEKILLTNKLTNLTTAIGTDTYAIAEVTEPTTLLTQKLSLLIDCHFI